VYTFWWSQRGRPSVADDPTRRMTPPPGSRDRY
jgi:hypothetical protein